MLHLCHDLFTSHFATTFWPQPSGIALFFPLRFICTEYIWNTFSNVVHLYSQWSVVPTLYTASMQNLAVTRQETSQQQTWYVINPFIMHWKRVDTCRATYRVTILSTEITDGLSNVKQCSILLTACVAILTEGKWWTSLFLVSAHTLKLLSLLNMHHLSVTSNKLEVCSKSSNFSLCWGISLNYIRDC